MHLEYVVQPAGDCISTKLSGARRNTNNVSLVDRKDASYQTYPVEERAVVIEDETYGIICALNREQNGVFCKDDVALLFEVRGHTIIDLAQVPSPQQASVCCY